MSSHHDHGGLKSFDICGFGVGGNHGVFIQSLEKQYFIKFSFTLKLAN